MAISAATIQTNACRGQHGFRLSRDVAAFPMGNSHKTSLPEASHAGFPAHHFVIQTWIWKRFPQDSLHVGRQGVTHNRETIQLLPKTVWGLECLNPQSI